MSLNKDGRIAPALGRHLTAKSSVSGLTAIDVTLLPHECNIITRDRDRCQTVTAETGNLSEWFVHLARS